MTYKVPASLEDLKIGDVVAVPMGSRTEKGYVVGRPDTTDVPEKKLKNVSRRLSDRPVFDPDQLAFFQWIANYYLQPLGQVIQTAIPSDVSAKLIRGLVATDLGIDKLTVHDVDESEGMVLREVIRRPGRTRQGVTRMLGEELDRDSVKRAVDRMIRTYIFRGVWFVWGRRPPICSD